VIVQKGIPKQRIDTGRIEAKSFLAGKRIIEVYVESQEDVTFWRRLFNFKNIKSIDVKPVRRIRGSNGKGEILKSILDGDLIPGRSLLIAIDSDYDFLKCTNLNFYNSPYIFQTYAYSIESYYFYPEHVLEACLNATNTSNIPTEMFRITEAFESWSAKNYANFISFIKDGNRDCSDAVYDSLSKLDISTLEKMPEFEICDELRAKGLNSLNLYLFINGHKLEEKVKQITKNVTAWLINREHRTIKGKTEEATKNLRKQFMNSLNCPNQELRASDLSDVSLMQFIYKDLEQYKDLAKDIL